jgi:Spy/CpxP family protein refolding chaperone
MILGVLLVSILSITATAQHTGNRHDKIENLKIAFITKKLNLTEKTAQDFWPIYNQYDHAKQRLFRKYKKQYRSQNLSMQDVEHRMEREKEFLELRKKYINRFDKVLSPVQLTDLKRAERQFKKLLLKRMQRRK